LLKANPASEYALHSGRVNLKTHCKKTTCEVNEFCEFANEQTIDKTFNIAIKELHIFKSSDKEEIDSKLHKRNLGGEWHLYCALGPTISSNETMSF
jgi:hypothetical protein